MIQSCYFPTFSCIHYSIQYPSDRIQTGSSTNFILNYSYRGSQTKGQEPLFLNKVLKPVVSLPSVQNVVLSNLNYYEPLLQHNIDQASDLKAELIKLYTSSQNEELRALIERLNIIDMKENETEVSAEN